VDFRERSECEHKCGSKWGVGGKWHCPITFADSMLRKEEEVESQRTEVKNPSREKSGSVSKNNTVNARGMFS